MYGSDNYSQSGSHQRRDQTPYQPFQPQQDYQQNPPQQQRSRGAVEEWYDIGYDFWSRELQGPRHNSRSPYPNGNSNHYTNNRYSYYQNRNDDGNGNCYGCSHYAGPNSHYYSNYGGNHGGGPPQYRENFDRRPYSQKRQYYDNDNYDKHHDEYRHRQIRVDEEYYPQDQDYYPPPPRGRPYDIFEDDVHDEYRREQDHYWHYERDRPHSNYYPRQHRASDSEKERYRKLLNGNITDISEEDRKEEASSFAYRYIFDSRIILEQLEREKYEAGTGPDRRPPAHDPRPRGFEETGRFRPGPPYDERERRYPPSSYDDGLGSGGYQPRIPIDSGEIERQHLEHTKLSREINDQTKEFARRQEILHARRARMQQLANDNNNLARNIYDLDSDIDKLSRERNEREQDLQRLLSIHKQLIDENKRLGTEENTLRADIERIRANLETRSRNISSITQQEQAEINRLGRDLTERERELNITGQHRRDLQSRIKSTEDDIQRQRHNIDLLERQNHDAQNNFDQNNRTLDTLKRNLDEITQEIRRQQQSCKELDQQLGDAIQTYGANSDEVRALEEHLRKSKEEVDHLDRQKTELSRQIHNKEIEKVQAVRHIDDYQRIIDDLDRDIANLKLGMEQKQHEIKEWQTQLASAGTDNTGLSEEIKNLQRKLLGDKDQFELLKIEREQLIKQTQEVRLAINDINNQIDRQKLELANEESRLQVLEDTLGGNEADRRKDILRLQQYIQQREHNIRELESELTRYQRHIDGQGNEISRLEQELGKLRNFNERQMAQINDLRQQIVAIESRIGTDGQNGEQLQLRLKALNDNLQRVGQEYEQTMDEIHAKEQQIERLQRETEYGAKTIQNHDRTISQLEERKRSIEEQLQNKTDLIEQWTKEIQAIETELLKLPKSDDLNNELQAKKQEFEGLRNNKTEELNLLQQQVGALQQNVGALQQNVAVVELQIQQETQEYEKLQRQYQQLTDNLNSVRLEHKQLLTRYEEARRQLADEHGVNPDTDGLRAFKDRFEELERNLNAKDQKIERLNEQLATIAATHENRGLYELVYANNQQHTLDEYMKSKDGINRLERKLQQLTDCGREIQKDSIKFLNDTEKQRVLDDIRLAIDRINNTMWPQQQDQDVRPISSAYNPHRYEQPQPRSYPNTYGNRYDMSTDASRAKERRAAPVTSGPPMRHGITMNPLACTGRTGTRGGAGTVGYSTAHAPIYRH